MPSTCWVSSPSGSPSSSLPDRPSTAAAWRASSRRRALSARRSGTTGAPAPLSEQKRTLTGAPAAVNWATSPPHPRTSSSKWGAMTSALLGSIVVVAPGGGAGSGRQPERTLEEIAVSVGVVQVTPHRRDRIVELPRHAHEAEILRLRLAREAEVAEQGREPRGARREPALDAPGTARHGMRRRRFPP